MGSNFPSYTTRRLIGHAPPHTHAKINKLLNTPIPPATTNNLGRMVLPALDPGACTESFPELPLVGIIVALGVQGHDVMTVVFSTRVLTTPLVVMVENWRLVEEESARTHEKRTKKAARATNGDKIFIEI